MHPLDPSRLLSNAAANVAGVVYSALPFLRSNESLAMRTFQTLNSFASDPTTGIVSIGAEVEADLQPRLSLRREGDYIAISASYGPIEIALRPRLQEIARALKMLQPVDGLLTTRQVGSGQVYIALGLQSDGTLLLRPTIVGDAGGHIAFNLALNSTVREALYAWLGS